MNRYESFFPGPVNHPPNRDFVAVLEIEDTPEPARRRSISLVEVLVVIAIVGVLVGLMMPAQTTRCGGATHTARTEREARQMEIERALAEQEALLGRTPAEETALMVSSHSE